MLWRRSPGRLKLTDIYYQRLRRGQAESLGKAACKCFGKLRAVSIADRPVCIADHAVPLDRPTGLEKSGQSPLRISLLKTDVLALRAQRHEIDESKHGCEPSRVDGCSSTASSEPNLGEN